MLRGELQMVLADEVTYSHTDPDLVQNNQGRWHVDSAGPTSLYVSLSASSCFSPHRDAISSQQSVGRTALMSRLPLTFAALE